MTAPSDNQARARNLRQQAGVILADLYQAIITQEDGVRAGDIEAVHDMRVASRRLRVALSNFAVCCVPELRREMRRQLGKLADALGAVRDFDVMIIALKSRSGELPPGQKQYIRHLIRRLRARRLRRRRLLLQFLQGTEYEDFKIRFPLLIQEVPAAGAVRENGEGLQSKESVA
ncbi:MAG TPA: CHAD domain-containing protein [Blastocatellia bacterium]|nr:CHAD domain-containing protein [Blastocatellia bacterium]